MYLVMNGVQLYIKLYYTRRVYRNFLVRTKVTCSLFLLIAWGQNVPTWEWIGNHIYHKPLRKTFRSFIGPSKHSKEKHSKEKHGKEKHSEQVKDVFRDVCLPLYSWTPESVSCHSPLEMLKRENLITFTKCLEIHATECTTCWKYPFLWKLT